MASSISQLELDDLNERFRDFVEPLSSNERTDLTLVIQAAFNIKSERNVRLWWTKATTRRDFLNRNSTRQELEKRYVFLKALLGDFPIRGPQKQAAVSGGPFPRGNKISLYLDDDYTRRAINRITIGLGTLVIEYDAYCEEDEYFTDEEVEEFSDFDF